MCASLEKTSSTFSPDRADVSIVTGIFWSDAQRAASFVVTALSTVSTGGRLSSSGMGEKIEFDVDDDDGMSMSWGCAFSGGVDKSDLLPTSSSVKFGEARARASVKNVGRDVKLGCEVMS